MKVRSAWSAGLALLLAAAGAAAVDPNSLRLAKRPAGAVEMTWQDGTPSSYCVLRDGAQPPVISVAGVSALTYADTPPTTLSLWNYAVTESTSCLTSVCAPAADLTCEQVRVGGNSAAAGSTANVSGYPGCNATGLTGSEFAYRFQSPQDLAVDLALSGLTSDLDLVVLDDGGACDPVDCIAIGDVTTPFNARAGATYTIVVDGRAAASGDYTLGIACAGSGCVAAAAPLACGGTVAGNNGAAGSTNQVRDYSPCALSGLTGPEQVHTFVAAADGPVTVVLGGLAADLDLAVLEDTGGGCRASECLRGGDDTVQFVAVAGRTYYAVVDGRDGAVSDYTLQVTCAPSACMAAGTLVCGTPAIGRTDDAGSTDAIDAYACSGADASGPEYVYSFTAASAGDVTFRLSGSTQAGVDLFVLDPASGCAGSSCIAHGDAEVAVAAVAGATYQLALDGPAAAAYSLSAICTAVPGTCRPVQALSCGDVRFGDTRSGLATDVNDAYPCSANDMTGPELTYEFAPPDRLSDYLVSLTLLPQGGELDVFVLRNRGAGCEPASCVAWDDASLDFTALASDQYFVTVDGRAGDADGYQVLVSCVTAPGPCQPAEPIACGDILLGRSNGGPGSTDRIDAYPTCPPIVFNETGPEYAYRFVATADEMVTVSLSNLVGGTAHLFVLEELGNGCDIDDCIAKGTTQVTFPAQAGSTYYIVTDGFNGAVVTFDVRLTCS